MATGCVASTPSPRPSPASGRGRDPSRSDGSVRICGSLTDASKDAVFEADGAVHTGGERGIVGGDEGREAVLPRETDELSENAVGGLRVEVAGGFVREK